jgi:hypothetical protein
MNSSQMLQDGYKRQSELLHVALEFCYSGHRRELGGMLQHKGVAKSRFRPDEQWVQALCGLTFQLFPANSNRRFGDKKRFHRLEVICPCCGASIPVGRFHQHAPGHINSRIAISRLMAGGYTIPKRRSAWPDYWYVNTDGNFVRTPREFQRAFPSQPAGF